MNNLQQLLKKLNVSPLEVLSAMAVVDPSATGEILRDIHLLVEQLRAQAINVEELR